MSFILLLLTNIKTDVNKLFSCIVSSITCYLTDDGQRGKIRIDKIFLYSLLASILRTSTVTSVLQLSIFYSPSSTFVCIIFTEHLWSHIEYLLCYLVLPACSHTHVYYYDASFIERRFPFNHNMELTVTLFSS